MTVETRAKALRPLSGTQARDVAARLPMWTRSTADLESWEPSRLSAEVQRTVDREKRFPSELAQRLDDVFLVKTVQLLLARNATQADFRALDLLMGSIASDEVQGELDAMPEHYAARWKALVDLTSVALKLRDFQQAAAERTNVPQHVWECVADAVLDARGGGVSWSELASVIANASEGPKSKGGISQLLTSMQAKAWLESVSRGRNKFFFEGPKISTSEAWRRRNDYQRVREDSRAIAMPERERPTVGAIAKAVKVQLLKTGASLPKVPAAHLAAKAAYAIVKGNPARKKTSAHARNAKTYHDADHEASA